jgi:hypothetical protein
VTDVQLYSQQGTGLFEDRERAALQAKLAAMQKERTAGKATGEVEIVCRKEQRLPTRADPRDRLAQRQRVRRVEARRGLVEKANNTRRRSPPESWLKARSRSATTSVACMAVSAARRSSALSNGARERA